MSRDSTGRIIHKDGRKIGNLPLLVAETLTTRTALKPAIQENYSRTIIESDSLTDIHAINGNPKPLRQICNLTEDINMLSKEIDNIKFVD